MKNIQLKLSNNLTLKKSTMFHKEVFQPQEVIKETKEFITEVKQNTQLSPQQKLEKIKDLLQSLKWVDKDLDFVIEQTLQDWKIESNEFVSIEKKLEELEKKEYKFLNIEKAKQIYSDLAKVREKLYSLKAETLSPQALIQKANELEKKIIDNLPGFFKDFLGWIVKKYFELVKKELKWEPMNLFDKFLKPFIWMFFGFILSFSGYGKQFAEFEKLLKYVKPELGKKLDRLKETTDVKEKKEEMIKAVEGKVRDSIKEFLKKVKGINISDEELENIIKELNLKQYFAENTQELQKVYKRLVEGENIPDANYGKWWLDVIKLPGGLVWRIFSVLRKKNYVSLYDMGVYFADKSVNFFIGSWGLLGSNMEYISGQMSTSELKEQIAKFLQESPDSAKEILAIMLYRHGGLVFHIASNIVNYLWKSLIYAISGETKLFDSIKSSIRWNIDEYLRVLKELEKIMPSDVKIKGEKGKTIILSDLFKNTVEELDEANRIVKILNEKGPEEVLKQIKEWRFEYFNDLKNFSAENLRSKLSARIEGIGKWLDTKISEVGAYLDNQFRWLLATKWLLNDFSHNIKRVTWYLSKVVNNDTLWRKATSEISKLGVLKETMSVDFLYDRAVYRFENIDSFEKFVNNLKVLSKQSPELLRFIFDKVPIFLVSWLIVSGANEEKTLSEKAAHITKELQLLVPFWGSGYLLIDALYVDRLNLEQAAVSSIILGSEVGYSIYLLRKYGIKTGALKLWQFITKPFVDLFEITTFLSRSWFVVGKTTIDLIRLIWTGKFELKALQEILISNRFPKLRWRLGIILTLLIIWWYTAYELLHQDELEEIFAECKKSWNIDKSCVDIKVKEQWQNLDQDTKTSLIAMWFWFRLGKLDWIEGKFADESYEVIFDKDFGTIPSYDKLEQIKKEIENIVKDKPIRVSFTKGLLQTVFEQYKSKYGDYTKEDFKNALLAMGYPENMVSKVIQDI